jgi:hypothetical protein
MKEENRERINRKAFKRALSWFNPNESAKYNYNYIEKCSENYTIDTKG